MPGDSGDSDMRIDFNLDGGGGGDSKGDKSDNIDLKMDMGEPDKK